MTRTLYIRNLFIFSLFVVVIFATPFLFAEVSAPTLKLNNVQIPLQSRYNLSQQQTLLKRNTVLQLPDEVAAQMVYQNGVFDLEATLKIWDDLAEQGRTPGAKDGLYPIKVNQSPDGSVDTSTKSAIGYIDMSALTENPGAFSLARLPVDELPPTEEEVNNGQDSDEDLPSYLGGDSVSSYPIETPEDLVDGGDSDATTPGGSDDHVIDPGPPAVSPSPKPRPDFNCQHERYETSSSKYPNNNCLSKAYGNNLKAKAQHVLSDLETINQQRAPRVITDPRFSLCIAYHESGLAPNAKNPNGDYGMYQIRNSTGKEALSAYGSIVPGFESYNSSAEYEAFKAKMLNSPLAQSDLHHSILLKKAQFAGLLSRLGSGTMTNSNYWNLAWRYNGNKQQCTYYGGNLKQYRYHYADRIRSCFEEMQKLANENGQIASWVSNDQLKKALSKAKFDKGKLVCR